MSLASRSRDRGRVRARADRWARMERFDIEERRLTLDDLAHVDEESGVEYWYARDIMGFLRYVQWRNSKLR